MTTNDKLRINISSIHNFVVNNKLEDYYELYSPSDKDKLLKKNILYILVIKCLKII